MTNKNMKKTKEFKYNNESLFKKLIARYNDGTKYKVFLFLLKQSKTKLYKKIENPNNPKNTIKLKTDE